MPCPPLGGWRGKSLHLKGSPKAGPHPLCIVWSPRLEKEAEDSGPCVGCDPAPPPHYRSVPKSMEFRDSSHHPGGNGEGGGDLSPGLRTTQMRSFPTLVTRTGYPHALLLGIRNPRFIPKAPSLIHMLSVSWGTAKVLE